MVTLPTFEWILSKIYREKFQCHCRTLAANRCEDKLLIVPFCGARNINGSPPTTFELKAMHHTELESFKTWQLLSARFSLHQALTSYLACSYLATRWLYILPIIMWMPIVSKQVRQAFNRGATWLFFIMKRYTKSAWYVHLQVKADPHSLGGLHIFQVKKILTQLLE